MSNGKEIRDPTGLLRDISKRGWGNLKHRAIMSADTDVDAVFHLLKQSYAITKSG